MTVGDKLVSKNSIIRAVNLIQEAAADEIDKKHV